MDFTAHTHPYTEPRACEKHAQAHITHNLLLQSSPFKLDPAFLSLDGDHQLQKVSLDCQRKVEDKKKRELRWCWEGNKTDLILTTM